MLDPVVEVREARYFTAVAEELHFGRAAARLHMSQPPLSQAVKALEQRLGVLLLHRTTREVRLTTAGEVLLQHCRDLVAAAETAVETTRAAAEGQLGRLRIGAVTSAFLDPLPVILAEFTAAHPRVDVRVHEVDTEAAVGQVRRRELDVVLVRQLATPPGCRRATLRTESFALAVPAAWEQAVTGGRLSAAADLPWIWLPREISPDYHDQVVACCRSAGFAPEARHTARSITSQLAMVGCGLGVALVPEGTARQSVRAGTGVRVVDLTNPPGIELSLVWHRAHSAVVQEFLRSARGGSEPGTTHSAPATPDATKP